LGQKDERGHETEIIEDGGSELVGKVTELLGELVEQRLDPLHPPALGRWQVASDFIERQVDRDEQLSGLIVERVGDPFGDLFQHLIETMERVLRSSAFGDI